LSSDVKVAGGAKLWRYFVAREGKWCLAKIGFRRVISRLYDDRDFPIIRIAALNIQPTHYYNTTHFDQWLILLLIVYKKRVC